MQLELTKASEKLAAVKKEISQVIVGQHDMVESILIGLILDGHILLEGVPGLAKTLAISALARATHLHFNRIQFTPDLLPSDLIGTMVFNPKSGEFTPKQGPLFAQMILADEINRAPAKVQSALLEAMAEKQVTIGETTYKLPQPFLVLATQNPVEQEGTYPLPEAQMDRFMLKVVISYPNRKEEIEIINRMARQEKPDISAVLSTEEVLELRRIADQIYIDDTVKGYVVDIVMATRDPAQAGLKSLSAAIRMGASPRASISLIRAAKGRALMQGRQFATIEDVQSMALSVLRHRILLSYEAEADQLKPEDIIRDLIKGVEVNR